MGQVIVGELKKAKPSCKNWEMSFDRENYEKDWLLQGMLNVQRGELSEGSFTLHISTTFEIS